ncbi:transposase [Streptomyces netropsis]|uniref:transposase n=1 Tax=Streptomyces netropsis TaxID=55404 RepID=UPI0037918976
MQRLGEHTGTRTAWRNGYREKLLTTQAEDLDLAIPKVRTGLFFASLLERRRRIDQALYAVIMEGYVHVVSTRSVDDLGGDTGISRSKASRICDDLDAGLPVFRAPRSHPLPLYLPHREELQGSGRAPDRVPGRGDRHRDHRGRRTRSPGADSR